MVEGYGMKIRAAGRVWDSRIEYFFYAWLEEASRRNMVEIFQIQPSWQVFPGLSWKRPVQSGGEEKRVLLRPKIYTADFRFSLLKSFPLHPSVDLGWTPEDAEYGCRVFVVDVKPPKRGSKQDWVRRFSDDQKALWAARRIFVERVEPWELFAKTYAPAPVFLDALKNKNTASKVKNMKNIQQFMDGVLEQKRGKK